MLPPKETLGMQRERAGSEEIRTNPRKVRRIGVKTMILTKEDLEEFDNNAKYHGSLCQAIRKGALSCEECKTHGPCRIAEYFDLNRSSGVGQLSLNEFI